MKSQLKLPEYSWYSDDESNAKTQPKHPNDTFQSPSPSGILGQSIYFDVTSNPKSYSKIILGQMPTVEEVTPFKDSARSISSQETEKKNTYPSQVSFIDESKDPVQEEATNNHLDSTIFTPVSKIKLFDTVNSSVKSALTPYIEDDVKEQDILVLNQPALGSSPRTFPFSAAALTLLGASLTAASMGMQLQYAGFELLIALNAPQAAVIAAGVVGIVLIGIGAYYLAQYMMSPQVTQPSVEPVVVDSNELSSTTACCA